MFNSTTVSERVLPVDPVRAQMEALELAGKFVEKHITNDNSFPPLIERMRITGLSGPTVSGLSEIDYPNVNGLTGLDNIKQLRTLSKVPLPPEIMEHFGHMQCRCMMGIFPEINRAWLTIDSDIYIWDFESGLDVAYYDGLSETILSVGLVKPKPGIFQNYIRHLLVLTTTVEIVVLGVTFSVGNKNVSRPLNELHLTPEIIYTLATDGIPVTVISSTENGRIFLGGKDGSLFEILYQKELGWWGKRCKKVNHSNRALSFLVPSLINAAFSDEDAISQISVDNSRHILYTLSDKGTVVAYDLGENGTTTRKVHSLSQNSIVQSAFQIVKTLDSANFKPIVSISAVDIRESSLLGLVAVTEIGARLYFTTGAAETRPTTLQLMHVRLPPGFAANAPATRPNTVHMALYTSGNLLLVTSPGNNQDKVWCLSGDIFPLHPTLCEQQSVVPLEGIVWALKEMKVAEPPNLALCEQPPLVVRQHYEPAKKFVVLTPQGAEILMISRPVDVLRQLLIDSNGPDSEAVKLYFRTQTEDQACATCLLIACNQNTSNVQLAEWATRAFFLYGGEPRIGTPQVSHLTSLQYSLPPGFNPSSVSTPLSSKSLYTSPDNSTVLYSAKHNGLYLYIGRILRPLWNTRIVQKVSMNNVQYLVSSVVGDEVAIVAGQLLALRSFLEKNIQISSAAPSSLSFCNTVDTPPSSIQPQRSRLQEVQLQEKRSLDALKVFVDHASQVLGFWKIMCEHQFHVITSTLNQDEQSHMLTVTFRDLITVEQELCSILINKLINTYLSDNTSIDPISLKLRDICPKLYHNEDAACTKASEIINVAKTKQNKDERERLLWSALKLCKDVAPRVNLSSVCREFVSCQFYEGVVEISIQCAAKCDPKDIGFHFYKNNQPPEDTVGYQAYAQRMECYREVTKVLDLLYHQSQSSPYLPRVPSTPGPPPPQPTELLPSTEYIAKADDLIQLCMNSSDQLLHVAVYDWMVSQRLYGDLINVAKPSVEMYLKQAATNSMRTDMSEFSDLLWKYQEHYGNHAAAAQILYSLAKKPSDHVNLTQRITYLGKAVMCMRSDEVGCAPHLGVFLHDLEDLLQVAKVQKQVLDVISNSKNNRAEINQQADEAIHRLNSSLLTITELYEDYAEPFNLWECKLSIIECSGHNDPDLIHQIWNSIIESELIKCSDDDKMSLVMNKVYELGKQYGVSSRCFPVSYLVWQLEQVNCELNASRTHVQNTLFRLGVSVTRLVDIYKALFLLNDRSWLQKGNEFYLIETIAAIGENIIDNPKLMKPSEKKMLLMNLQDLISNCLSMLYSRPDTKALINQLKSIQSNLNRL